MKFLVTADGTVLPFIYYEEFRDGILLLKDGTSGTKSFLVVPSDNQEDNELKYGVACMYDSEHGPLTTENFDKFQVFVDIMESYTSSELGSYAGLLKYWKTDVRRPDEVVIVVPDADNSYFCGIDKNDNVVLSSSIRKAIKFEKDSVKIEQSVNDIFNYLCYNSVVEPVSKSV